MVDPCNGNSSGRTLPNTIGILFADEHLVVVDKPAGIPSVPARSPNDPSSVITQLTSEWGFLEAVHRLDRDTSGLLILARNLQSRTFLGKAFESRAVHKRYLSVVHGSLPDTEGVVHLPLADDPYRPPRKRIDPILGRRAASRWRQIAQKTTVAGLLSLLELEPITGRSHQLRAHLAWLGTPIVGDQLYDNTTRTSTKLKGVATRLALHAAWISFPHPANHCRIELSCQVAAIDPWTTFSAAERDWN